MGRMEKINQQMKREISQMILTELQDPKLMFVSVTNVNVSPDLRHAIVSISVLDEAKKDEVLKSLDRVRGYFRKLIGSRMRLRYTPEIEFVYDRSIELSSKIEEKIAEINDEDKENS